MSMKVKIFKELLVDQVTTSLIEVAGLSDLPHMLFGLEKSNSRTGYTLRVLCVKCIGQKLECRYIHFYSGVADKRPSRD